MQEKLIRSVSVSETNSSLKLRACPEVPSVCPLHREELATGPGWAFGVLEVAAQSTSCQMKFVQDVIDLSASLFDLFVARVVNVTPPSS
jgi:hypothetical protein